MRSFVSFLIVVLMLLASVATPVHAQQIVTPYISNDATPLRAWIEQVATTTLTLFSSAGTGVRNYITQITCINSSTAAGLILDVYDGGATTGAAALRKAQVGCPASSANSTVHFIPPLKLSATTAVYVAIGTTNPGTQAIHVYASGYTAR